MIRLALPKGRNLDPVVSALAGAGLDLSGLDRTGRRLRQQFESADVEVLLLKDWDLPLYVEQGVADAGFVGTDVLGESEPELLVPIQLEIGRSRLSFVGPPGGMPRPGTQVKVASKFPRTARRAVAGRSWSAEIFTLNGSVELAPLLELSDLALDIVQTGATIRAHGLVELEQVAVVAPALVLNRASFQRHRVRLNRWIDRLESTEEAV